MTPVPLPRDEWAYKLTPGFLLVAKHANGGALYWTKYAIPVGGWWMERTDDPRGSYLTLLEADAIMGRSAE